MSNDFQEIREIYRDMHNWLQNSRIGRFGASIPMPKAMKRYCGLRVLDIADICMEIQFIFGLVLHIYTKTGYYGANWRKHQKTGFWADVKVIVEQHNFDEMIAIGLPHTFALYMLGLRMWTQFVLRTSAIRAWIRWSIYEADHKHVFRVLFKTSPADASRTYRANLRCYPASMRDPFVLEPFHGTIHFHFFTSLEQAKSVKKEHPYIAAQLHLTEKGVDLSRLRRMWGIDNLAVVANIAPFRTIFNPANEDWLSPLAAYDLSQQFTAPIKVYEPRPSTLTCIARKVHDVCYPTVHAVLALLKLLAGSPNTSPAYHETLSIMYGRRNAERYRKIADLTRPSPYLTAIITPGELLVCVAMLFSIFGLVALRKF